MRKTGDIPLGRTPGRFSGAKTGDLPRSAFDGAEPMNRSSNQKRSQTNSVAGSYIASHRSASGLASRPASLELVGVSRCPGTMTERVERSCGKVALTPVFAFAGAACTTRGPVAQNATTTVFGRLQLGFRNV